MLAPGGGRPARCTEVPGHAVDALRDCGDQQPAKTGLDKDHKGGESGQPPLIMDNEDVDGEGHDDTHPASALEAAEHPRPWVLKGSLNNLVDAVKLHCDQADPFIHEFLTRKHADLDRFLLRAPSVAAVRQEHAQIMEYCARDVLATMALYRSIWRTWSRRACPHPVTLAAVLEMGSKMALTVQSDPKSGWPQYIGGCQDGFEGAEAQVQNTIQSLIEATAAMEPEEAKRDPWLKHLDWTPVPARYTKPKPSAKKDTPEERAAKLVQVRPIGNEKLFGKPLWYKALFKGGECKPTARLRILPYLLRMTYKEHPVVHVDKMGWCYSPHAPPSGEDTKSNVLLAEQGEGEESGLQKIPHPEQEGANVGSLFAKAFLPSIQSGIITSKSEQHGEGLLDAIVKFITTWSYWTSYRDRIKSQMVIWDGEPGVELPEGGAKRTGIIVPSVIPMGTVTRRAVEATWMTASNSKPNLAASEMKSKIMVPPPSPHDEYVFMGADVDSQELWIASIIGDAQFGECGATALAWMTLQGTKAEGTDLHSRTASILGMSRDHAKVFNYGRIYGAGVKFAAELLCKFNPKMTLEEARKKAEQLYAMTKGQRIYARSTGKGAGDAFVQYTGGSESYMFNSIEAIARSEETRTPGLNAEISSALKSSNVANEVITCPL